MAHIGIQAEPPPIPIHRGPAAVGLQACLPPEQCRPPGPVLLLLLPAGPGQGGPRVPVHQHQLAVLYRLEGPRCPQHRRDAKGPGQDGRMAGRASCLCEDGGHPLPVQPHGHGRGQLPGHKDAARRKAAQICLPPAQQRPQQTALQIPDVRSPQAHPLILQPLKQPDISAEHGVHRRLSGLPLLDGPVQLELQLRVPKHGDLAGEDGRLTFPGPDPHPLGQGGGLPLHLAGRRPQAGPLVLHPGVPSSGAVRRRRPETDRRAHPHAPRGSDPPQDHGAHLLFRCASYSPFSRD